MASINTSTNTSTTETQGTASSTSQEALSGELSRVERAQSRRRVLPAVDILETADATLVVADLPGVTSEGLEIEIQHNELRLRARAEARFDEDALDYVRAFRLPPGIVPEEVTADLHHGVLTLTLPKPAEQKPRRIDVRSA